jgi:hypothetical protein
VNCDIALPKSPFKGANGRSRFGIRADDKAGGLRNQALDFLEIIHLIGCDPDPALRNKRSMNGPEKIACHHAATPMPPLWPGIGKEEMEHFNRSGRQEVLNGIETFHAQNTGVLRPAALNVAARPAHSASEPFDSKKVVPGIRFGAGDQERPVTAAQINLQRGPTSIYRRKIERPEIVLRKDFGFPCCDSFCGS